MLFTSLKSHIAAFIADESGVVLIEYIIVILLILIAAIPAIQFFSLRIQSTIANITDAIP